MTKLTKYLIEDDKKSRVSTMLSVQLCYCTIVRLCCVPQHIYLIDDDEVVSIESFITYQ